MRTLQPIIFLTSALFCGAGQKARKGAKNDVFNSLLGVKNAALPLYSCYDRAKKDRYNREKGIRKLEKHVQRGRLTKASINSRGYNKFLKLDDQIKVTLDEGKIKQDSRWDGLKGYLTNARLSKDHQVIKNYQHLWQIEAHICISFVAYKVYKERRGAKYILSLFRFGC